MKRNHVAAATAILGLAFHGGSANAGQESADGNDLFSAVDNAAATSQAVTPQAASSEASDATVGASGAALNQAALSTGNTNTVQTANTVFSACSGGDNVGTQFQADCTPIVVGGISDPSGSTAALVSLTPDQIIAPKNTAVQQVKAGIGVAAMRMANLRLASGVTGFAPNELIAGNQLYGQPSGGGASGDLQFGAGGAFFNLKYLGAEQDSDAYTSGYDLDGWRLTLGGDYRVRENFILGLFGSYSSSSIDYQLNKGNMDMDGWGLGAYGTYYMEGGVFFEGTLGYDSNSYDLKRRIDYSIENQGVMTDVRQTAKSSPEADVFYASLGGGYQIDAKSWTLTPALSLNYIKNDIDSYRESMSNPSAPGGSLAVAYDSQDYSSLTSRLGVTVAKAISSETGVFVPQLSLDWVHEYLASQDVLNASFVNDLSNTPLLITTTKPDHNYFDLGVGVSGQFAQGFSAFLSVNTLLGYDDLTSYSITGGLRKEF